MKKSGQSFWPQTSLTFFHWFPPLSPLVNSFFLILHIKNYLQNLSIVLWREVKYGILIFTCRMLDRPKISEHGYWILGNFGHRFGCVKTYKRTRTKSKFWTRTVVTLFRHCFEDGIRDTNFSFQNSGGQIFNPDNMISVVRQYDGTVKSISG